MQFVGGNGSTYNLHRSFVAKSAPRDDEGGVQKELIKAQDGPDLILSGSSMLTSTLEHGLAEEVVLLVNPVLLGTGKLMFADGTPARAFELASTKALPSGIVINAYKAAGLLKNQP